MNTRKLFMIAGSLLTLIFILGLGRLFVLRFKTGDIYPAYSSLRSDPLGTMVFYESLKHTGRIAVARNFGPLKSIRTDPPVTLFYLGVPASFLSLHSPELIRSLQALAAGGGRLVLTLNPQRERARASLTDEDRETQRAANRQPQGDSSESSPEKDTARTADNSAKDPVWTIESRWHVSAAYDRSLEKPDRIYLNPDYAESGLPPVISRHSTLCFEDLSADWRVIYQTGGRPVVIEKSFGRGQIVLLADTFWASNEALRDERHPGLLAWLVGLHSQVVFDEAHLGMREAPGVVALARRNRLHWPLMGIVLLAILFVWKHAVPLVPPPEGDPAEPTGAAASAKDYTQGLISLLYRSISQSKILETAMDQWQKDLPQNKALSASRRNRIRAVLDAGETSPRKSMDPVWAYNKIYTILSERSDDEP